MALVIMQFANGLNSGTRIRTQTKGTRTTSVFTAFSVRGLDFAFTVSFDLGAARQVSTPSDFSAWLGVAS
jgi:hypothetical protein